MSLPQKAKRLTDPQVLGLQFYAWAGLPPHLRSQAKRPRAPNLKTRNNLLELRLLGRVGGDLGLTPEGHLQLKRRLGTALYPRGNELARFIEQASVGDPSVP